MSKATKKQLGKGLGALLSSMGMDEEQGETVQKDISTKPKKAVKKIANTIAMIPISKIKPNPLNPRLDFEDKPLQDLVASIRVHGLIQPITVRPTKEATYQIISGERRWRASKEAGLSKIPAYIRVVNSNEEMLELALIENIQREDLNPYEIAVSYQRLIEDCKLTHAQLSERLGKGRTTITNTISLLDLAPDIIDAIKARKITEGHAKVLKGLPKIEQQLEALKRIKANDLSVRATQKLCDALRGKTQKKRRRKTVHPHQDFIDDFANDFGEFLGTNSIKVKVNNKGKGSITISVEDFDQLEFFKDKVR